MTVKELCDSLGLEILNLSDGDRKIEGGYCGDLLSWVMGRAKSGDAWVTIMNNLNVVAVASLTDCACVIFAENSELDEKLVETAGARDINLLRSEFDAFTLCGEIYRLCHE